MAAGTLTAPPAATTEEHAEATAPNRIDEHDADYVRLHSGTVARLQSSLRRYVRDLRASGHDAHRQMAAAQAFIQRHTAILRDAYAAGWREGHRDYYSGASASSGIPSGVTVTPPTAQQQGKQLSFYAPSVAKMAAEGLRALQEEQVAKAQGTKLSESITLATSTTDSLGAWADGLQQRVALQAEIIWPALQDGYSTAGGTDAARPFSQLWWQLQPVKTDHCADCPWVAYNSPYDPPGSGGNELAQTPGDGRTECGAACHCTLSYGGFELPQDADWAQYMAPPDAPFANAPANPGRIPAAVRQQGQNHYRPGRMPMGVDANGDYVYAGTPQEQEMAAQRGQSLYGTIREPRPGDEPFTVAPIAAGTQALSTKQLQALDAFRSAWSRWNAVRGARPAARSLFGYVYDEQRGTFARPSATTGLLVPQRNPAGFAQRAGPNGERFANSWDELNPRQQAALADLYRAIAAWDSATKDAGGSAEQQLSEDYGDVVKLTGGHHQGYGGGPGEQQHGQHGHWTVGQGDEREGGSGGGARLAPIQRAQQEHALAQERAQRERIASAVQEHDAWLAGHAEADADYARISDQRLRLKQAHDVLSDRITARENTLGLERSARPELGSAPKPKSAQTATTGEVPSLPPLEQSYRGVYQPYQPHENLSHLTPEQRADRIRQQNREQQARFRTRHPERYEQYLDQPGAREAHKQAVAARYVRVRDALRAAQAKAPHERTAEEEQLIAVHQAKAAQKAVRRAQTRDTQRLTELADELLRDTITLTGGHDKGYGDQPGQQFHTTHGHWGPGQGEAAGGGGGGHEAMQREAAQAMRVNRGIKGGGGGANLAPHQRAQKEQELAHYTAQRDRIEAAIPKMDAWLSSHTEDEPGYAKIGDQRLQAQMAHEKLQELIENRQQLLGIVVTARHEIAPMPKALAPASLEPEAHAQAASTPIEPPSAPRVPGLGKRYTATGKRKPETEARKDLSKMTDEERAAHLRQKTAEAQERYTARHPERAAGFVRRYQVEHPDVIRRNQAKPEQREKARLRAQRQYERKKAAAEAAKTQQLMEEFDALLRDCAVLLATTGEDRVESITLTVEKSKPKIDD